MAAKRVYGQVVDKKPWADDPYSFVNAPHRRPLECYFISLPDGTLTQRLVAPEGGDSIPMAPRANGSFALSEVPEGDHLGMLATGTATGPFISVLRTDEPWRRIERVVLVHAVRSVEELADQDDIRGFGAAWPDRFRMVAFVNREDTDFAIRGRIPAAIGDGRPEQATGLSIDPACSPVMICGNPDTPHDTTEVLEARGRKKNQRKAPGQITVESDR